jgi:hypothetical protein
VIRSDIVAGGLSGSQQAAAAAASGQASCSTDTAVPVQRATSGYFDDVLTQNTAPSNNVSFKTAASVKGAADKWKSKSKKR